MSKISKDEHEQGASMKMNTDKKNVSKSIFKSAAKVILFPIVVPFVWVKGDAKNIIENTKLQYQGVFDRNLKKDFNESKQISLKNTPALAIESLENSQILINLDAITNRWKMFVMAYAVSMISVIWGLISFNLLIFMATSVWMVFFWANASRLAWSFHRLDQSLSGINHGISFRAWLRINWTDNLPLPPRLKKFNG